MVPLLRAPPPVLLKGDCVKGAISPEEEAIAVGDVVSFELLEEGIPARVAIVDGRTKRGPFPHLKEMVEAYRRVLRCRNEPGGIDRSLWLAVREALSSPERTLILVEGEEDMAAIPAILEAPDGTLVLYGLPDRGVGVIPVSSRTKGVAEEIVRRMVVEDASDDGDRG